MGEDGGDGAGGEDLFRSPESGRRIGRADDEQTVEREAELCCGRGVEEARGVDDSEGGVVFGGDGGEAEGEREGAGAFRGGDDLAHAGAGDASAEGIVEAGQACGQAGRGGFPAGALAVLEDGPGLFEPPVGRVAGAGSGHGQGPCSFPRGGRSYLT